MFRVTLSIFMLTLPAITAWADNTIHHKMVVSVDPVTHQIQATDTLTIPASLAKEGMILKINRDLTISKIAGNVRFNKVAENMNAPDLGSDRENYQKDTIVKVNHFALTGLQPGKAVTLTLNMHGIINNPVVKPEGYAGGIPESPGLIEERGVYLAGATYWVPTVEDTLITYELDATMPANWRSVSQGVRTKHETGDQHEDGWKADTPTEEIFLIAAQFTEYEISIGNVKAMAFLRTADDALADRYLGVTEQYMNMYNRLIGPYPYNKFALVENFWATGYGMPSFTLLGSQIIRFPFILHSSYPHELLHNWWGNSVYIDFETGNWAEGLTLYMADHLVAEQRGIGANYRRSTLQRYTNSVTPETDFPLRKFISRESVASEIIGYGKTSIVWNMLRVEVGDENFKRGFQRFYRDNKYKVGSFDDIRIAFETTTGQNLKPFFSQWVDRIGAPKLTIAKTEQLADALKITLEQQQEQPVFSIKIPVAIYTADTVERHLLTMDQRKQKFSIAAKNKVVKIEIDPEFDLFRYLHSAEMPPLLNHAFRSKQSYLILPANASQILKKRYEKLASNWKGKGKFTVILDSDIDHLPKDGTNWVLGRDNKFYSVVENALHAYNASITTTGVTLGTQTLATANYSSVIVVRNPDNPQSAVVGITAHNDIAAENLARKLGGFAYSKYSYLAFSSGAMDSSAKGQWPPVGSPMTTILDKSITSTAKLKPRPALEQLEPNRLN